VRIISSSIIAQILDNTIFMMLAFLGVLPFAAIITMIIGGTIIEVLCEVIYYPATRRVIKRLKES
jgi:hypothetical protein